MFLKGSSSLPLREGFAVHHIYIELPRSRKTRAYPHHSELNMASYLLWTGFPRVNGLQPSFHAVVLYKGTEEFHLY